MTEAKRRSNTPWLVLTTISRLPVFAVLILLYLLFVLYLFPRSASGMERGPLDLMFSYSPTTAYEMIESYGEDGRARYARSAMTLDVAYPIVYTLLFSVWITLVIGDANLSTRMKGLVAMTPLSVFTLDLLENAGIVALLRAYPIRHETLATVTSVATTAKWCAAIVVILTALGATAHFAWRTWRDRTSS